MVELTYNWDREEYPGGRNFGHLAYRVKDIYAVCQKLMDGGVTINRPPRDGHMAFVRSPDGISIELLQEAATCRRPSRGRRCPTRERGSPAGMNFRSDNCYGVAPEMPMRSHAANGAPAAPMATTRSRNGSRRGFRSSSSGTSLSFP